MTTLPRRSTNYHPACEAAVNHQIHLELYVIYVYKSMASYFEKNMSLKYVGQFILGQTALLKEHVEGLIRLHNQRTGKNRKYDGNDNRPEFNYWDSSLKALDHALNLAVNVNQNLLSLRKLAVDKKDARLADFLEDNTLQSQVKSIEELRAHISAFPMYPRNPEDSLAENLLDKLSLDDKKK